MNCWSVLGIQPTDDQRTIKRAYAAKSKLVHPEEHPEEFRELHEAYEQALSLSKNFRPIVQVKPESTASENQNLPASKGEELFEDELEESEFIGDRSSDEKIAEDEKTKDEELFGKEFRKAAKTAAENSEEEPTAERQLKGIFGDDLEVVDSKGEELFGIDFENIIADSEREQNQHIEDMTDEIMSEIEAALTVRSDNKQKKLFSKALSGDRFNACVNHPYFAYRLTEFIKGNHKLPDTFYLVVYSALRLDILSTREQKGFYTEIYEIFIARKKMGFKVFELKREADSKGLPTWMYLAIVVIFFILQGLRVTRHIVDIPDYFEVGALVAAMALFVIAFIMRKRKQKELEDGKPDESDKHVITPEKESFWSKINPVRRVRETCYFKLLTVTAWLALLGLSLLWMALEYEGLSLVISVFALFLSIFVLAFILLLNVISFIYSKIKHIKPENEMPLEKKKAQRKLTAMFAIVDIIFFVLAFAMMGD